jgi:hypothetical protein
MVSHRVSPNIALMMGAREENSVDSNLEEHPGLEKLELRMCLLHGKPFSVREGARGASDAQMILRKYASAGIHTMRIQVLDRGFHARGPRRPRDLDRDQIEVHSSRGE